MMVQRTLASKSMLHAKGGAVFASFLKLSCFGLFTIPGMASRVMYPGRYCLQWFAFISTELKNKL